MARRRDVKNPGLGTMYLEKMLSCPQEHLEFPIWYLKQRNWIETLENGQLAITADGVDKVTEKECELRTDRLLPESKLDTPSDDGPRSADSDVSEAVSEDEIPGGSDFLDEAFADDAPPKARA